MCKILIRMRGGLVEHITTDRQMTIVIVDYDNAEIIEDADDLVDVLEPDTILQGGEKLSKQFGESIDSADQMVYDRLIENEL